MRRESGSRKQHILSKPFFVTAVHPPLIELTMKHKIRRGRILFPAAVGFIWLGCIGMSHAGVIVDYNFSANPYPATQPTSVAPTTLASDIISSAIDSGTGTGGAGAGNGGGTNGTGLSIDYTNPGGSTYPNDFLRPLRRERPALDPGILRPVVSLVPSR